MIHSFFNAQKTNIDANRFLHRDSRGITMLLGKLVMLFKKPWRSSTPRFFVAAIFYVIMNLLVGWIVGRKIAKTQFETNTEKNSSCEAGIQKKGKEIAFETG